MPMFDVTVLSENADEEVFHDKVMAVDDEAALDQVTARLDKQGISYGLCMADEV